MVRETENASYVVEKVVAEYRVRHPAREHEALVVQSHTEPDGQPHGTSWFSPSGIHNGHRFACVPGEYVVVFQDS